MGHPVQFHDWTREVDHGETDTYHWKPLKEFEGLIEFIGLDDARYCRIYEYLDRLARIFHRSQVLIVIIEESLIKALLIGVFIS